MISQVAQLATETELSCNAQQLARNVLFELKVYLIPSHEEIKKALSKKTVTSSDIT